MMYIAWMGCPSTLLPTFTIHLIKLWQTSHWLSDLSCSVEWHTFQGR